MREIDTERRAGRPAAGYWASIAASVLDAAGRRPVCVDDRLHLVGADV